METGKQYQFNIYVITMYEFKERTAIDYPSEAFDEFECILT